MRRYLVFTILLIFFKSDVLTAQDSTRYDVIYDQLMTMTGSEVRMSQIGNYTINRNASKFTLNNGQLFLLGPVDGRIISAVYKGKGTFWFTPPTQIERDQLFRFYETDTLEQEFKYLFMIFSDSTATELQSQFDFSHDIDPDEVEDLENELEDIFEYIGDEDNRYFRSDIMKFLLDNTSSGYFYAHLFKNKTNPLMYEINPYQKEDIRLMHRADLGHIYKIPEVVCQFVKNGNDSIKFKNDFLIKKFTIETSISEGLEFSARAILDIYVNNDDQKWLAFNIYHDMEIDSIKTSMGNTLNYFKPEETRVFWVECNRYLNRGDSLTIIIDYHCDDILYRDTRSWIYLKSPNYWYPRNAIWDLAEYHLIFHYPENMTLVSIGRKVSAQVKNDTITAVWRPKKLVTHAAFNLGFFEKHAILNDSLSDGLIVLKTKQGLMFRSRDIEEEIAKDVTGSIEFYAQKYGEVPFDGLYVSEVPFPHGMAFKGLLNLAWSTFYTTDYRGYDQVFRAHEVAHQWWGIEVGFDSYHDQWLSESFSEFSGIWYLQQQEDGMDKFDDMMNDWHELILTNRKYMFDTDQESGPIWLGVRTSSSQTAGDYSLIVYKKGAWVLHMLRMMFYDWYEKSDAEFTRMMQDYYFTYKGRKATTGDFQRIVERHFEKPMDWFFKQWIYGTEIPKYYFALETSESNSGKYKLEIVVRQDDRQELFCMPIPIEVLYEDETHEYFTIDINQKITSREYILNKEPDEIIINPLHAVLAEWDEVDLEEIYE